MSNLNWFYTTENLPSNPTGSHRLLDNSTVHRQEVIIKLKKGGMVRSAFFEKIVCDDPMNINHNAVRFVGIDEASIDGSEACLHVWDVDDVACWLLLPPAPKKTDWVSILDKAPELGYTPANLRAIMKQYHLRDWQANNITQIKGKNNLGRYRRDVDEQDHDDMPHQKWLLLLEYVKKYDEWATAEDPAEQERLSKILYTMRGGDLNPKSKTVQKAAMATKAEKSDC